MGMTLIRCEHPDGFRPLDGVYDVGWDWGHLPCPREDHPARRGHDIRDDEVCAALPDKLDEWFPEWVRPLLRERGYRFVVLDAPKEAIVYFGKYQAVIRREACHEVAEFVQ